SLTASSLNSLSYLRIQTPPYSFFDFITFWGVCPLHFYDIPPEAGIYPSYKGILRDLPYAAFFRLTFLAGQKSEQFPRVLSTRGAARIVRLNF
ncbi:MAG: hypothetical protein AB7D36_07715, partial [Oscillospiraceae bacterium]